MLKLIEINHFRKKFDFDNESLIASGFPVSMTLKKSENLLIINTKQISDIRFLHILEDYYKAFIIYFQKPYLISEELNQKIEKLTKKKLMRKNLKKLLKMLLKMKLIKAKNKNQNLRRIPKMKMKNKVNMKV